MFVYLVAAGLVCGMSDLVPDQDQTQAPAMGGWSLAPGPPGKS